MQACDAATLLGPASISGRAGTRPLRSHDFHSQPKQLPTAAAAAAPGLIAAHLTVHQQNMHWYYVTYLKINININK